MFYLVFKNYLIIVIQENKNAFITHVYFKITFEIYLNIFFNRKILIFLLNYIEIAYTELLKNECITRPLKEFCIGY